eukprot:7331359-Prymnesium_polylepis.3
MRWPALSSAGRYCTAVREEANSAEHKQAAAVAQRLNAIATRAGSSRIAHRVHALRAEAVVPRAVRDPRARPVCEDRIVAAAAKLHRRLARLDCERPHRRVGLGDEVASARVACQGAKKDAVRAGEARGRRMGKKATGIGSPRAAYHPRPSSPWGCG